MVEDEPVVRDRLAMRPGRDRLLRRRRPVPDDHVVLAELGGMVQHPGHVGRTRPGQQGGQDRLVARHPTDGRQRVHYGPAGQLVPERDPPRRHGQHAPLLGFGERGDAARHERVDEPAVHSGRNDRELLQRVAGRRIQAGQPGAHRPGDGRRYHAQLARREDHGDEERHHLLGIGSAEPPYRVDRQRRQCQPPYPRRRRREPEQLRQRMVAGQLVVPVGQHEHDGQLADPADEVPQHVQGRLVGPVDVLHDQYRRMLRPLQLGPQRLDDPAAVAGLQRPGQRGAHAARQVAQRPEDPRRGQVVAVPDEQPALRRQYRPQRIHEAGLADAGLADDEHHRGVAALLLAGGRAQLGELPLAFQDRPTHPPDSCTRRRRYRQPRCR